MVIELFLVGFCMDITLGSNTTFCDSTVVQFYLVNVIMWFDTTVQ